CIASWISTYISRRMLRCFTCFAHWQLRNLWLSHPAAGGLELQEPRKFWSHPDPLDNTDELACRDKMESDIIGLEKLLGSAAANSGKRQRNPHPAVLPLTCRFCLLPDVLKRQPIFSKSR